MKNECGKMRDRSNPYEIWQAGDWFWYVLKKWQSPEGEAKNPYARWFCLVRTPIVPQGEMGDVYVQEIKQHAHKLLPEDVKRVLESKQDTLTSDVTVAS